MKNNFIHYLYPSLVRGVLGLFVMVPLTTYYLSPEDFGIIGLVTAVSNFVMPASTVGPAWVLAAFYYKIAEGERGELIFNVLFWGVVLRLLFISTLWFSGPFFLPVLIKSYSVFYLYIFRLYLLAEAANCLWETVSYVIVLQKNGKTFALVDVSQFFSQMFVLYLGLVVFKLQVLALPLANLASMTAGFVWCWFYIYPRFQCRFRRKWSREIVRLGLPTIPLNVFETISSSVERFFIERWVGLAQLGIYTHSISYRGMFNMPMNAFSRSISPEILEAVSKEDTARKEDVNRILMKWFGLLTLLGIFVVLFSSDAIALLTHNKFTAAAPLVGLWYLLIFIYSYGLPYTKVIYAQGKNSFIVKTDIGIGILSWGVTALAVKFFGAFGATLAILTYFFSIHSIRRNYALKLDPFRYNSLVFWAPVSIFILFIFIRVYLFPFPVKLVVALLCAVLTFRFFALPYRWQDIRRQVYAHA